jgi:hypothetical protein
MKFFLSSTISLLAAAASVNALSINPPPGTPVILRVEGLDKTIYEGTIVARPESITTASGGTHHCDGTNNGANPVPGPTCSSALSAAAKKSKFSFDGSVLRPALPTFFFRQELTP